jgi:hypothetical protein
MIFAFMGAIIGYIGIISMQRKWHKRGLLTEASFVLLQVPVLSLIILLGFLAFSTTLRGTIIGSIISLICTIFGIPVARRIYRKYLMPVT